MSERQTKEPRVRRRTRDLDLETPATLEAEEGFVTVARTVWGKETEEERGRVRVPVFGGNPARVRVEGSVTRNLGDYNSARVTVAVELPCHPESTEIERAYERASYIVDEWVNRELVKVDPSLADPE